MVDQELFEDYKHDPTIEKRNAIVEKNLYMVDILIRKYLGKGVDYDDLYQIGALALRLPDGLRGLDAELLRRVVLGEDDAVAGLGIAADRHGQALQLRVGEQLHAGEKAVQIAVEDDAAHRVRT